MKFKIKKVPRKYIVGLNKDITISDCGKIFLNADEQVTFVTSSGKEHDFTAKDWGFYSTPSMNSRLLDQGFKTALVKSFGKRYFIMTVEKKKMNDFKKYLKGQKEEIIEWLDERK